MRDSLEFFENRAINVIGFALAVLVLLSLSLPATQQIRKAKRSGCINRLRQLGIAVQNYQSSQLQFPPAYTFSSDGRRLHGWRTFLLPELEMGSLHESIDRLQSWSAPIHDAPRGTVVELFRCPDSNLKSNDVTTSYIGISGETTIWRPDGDVVCVQDLRDGSSNTIMLVESRPNRLPWMSPNDVSLAQLSGTLHQMNELLDSPHDGGANVTLADGSTRYIPNSISRDTLMALLTIDAGDEVGELE